jgi:hypothetical protein
MNVRELIEVLGAGDLDREVWVSVKLGPRTGGHMGPLQTVEDWEHEGTPILVLEREEGPRRKERRRS